MNRVWLRATAAASAGACAMNANALVQVEIAGTVIGTATGGALDDSDFAMGSAVSLTYLFDETVANAGDAEFGSYAGALLSATISTATGVIHAGGLLTHVFDSSTDQLGATFDSSDADVLTSDVNGHDLQFGLHFFDFDGASLDSSSLADALTQSRLLAFSDSLLDITEVTGDFSVTVVLDGGTLVVTNVPAPGAVGLIACAGVCTSRRRRVSAA